MYSGPLKKIPFQPDPTRFRHENEREALVASFKENTNSNPQSFQAPACKDTLFPKEKEGPKSLAQLIDLILPEDSALVALIVFLLCDNTENDVVLLGILLYILLSK